MHSSFDWPILKLWKFYCRTSKHQLLWGQLNEKNYNQSKIQNGRQYRPVFFLISLSPPNCIEFDVLGGRNFWFRFIPDTRRRRDSGVSSKYVIIYKILFFDVNLPGEDRLHARDSSMASQGFLFDSKTSLECVFCCSDRTFEWLGGIGSGTRWSNIDEAAR